MRRRAASIAIGLAAACFALLAYVFLTLPDVRPLATRNPATTAFIKLVGAATGAASRAACSAGCGTKPYRRTCARRCWWRRTTRSGPTMGSTSSSERVDREQSREGKARRRQHDHPAARQEPLPVAVGNPIRKLRELLIARRLEASLSKRRIFEIYLNVIEWGDGSTGRSRVAHVLRQVGHCAVAEEAALLAGAIINPRVHSPAHPTPRLRRRQQIILRRMGLVTPPEEAPESGAAAAADGPAWSQLPTSRTPGDTSVTRWSATRRSAITAAAGHPPMNRRKTAPRHRRRPQSSPWRENCLASTRTNSVSHYLDTRYVDRYNERRSCVISCVQRVAERPWRPLG